MRSVFGRIPATLNPPEITCNQLENPGAYPALPKTAKLKRFYSIIRTRAGMTLPNHHLKVSSQLLEESRN